jgi:hypothetical protein
VRNLRREQLELGMVVARDVTGRSGEVLICAGTPLRERELRMLATWGVGSVWVEADEAIVADPAEGLDAREEARIRERFQHNDLEHPFVRELFAQACLRARSRAAAEGANEA